MKTHGSSHVSGYHLFMSSIAGNLDGLQKLEMGSMRMSWCPQTVSYDLEHLFICGLPASPETEISFDLPLSKVV